MDNVTTGNTLQVLRFLLRGNVNFCINIQYIEKVLPLVFLETVPNSPFYLVGLMNLAGTSIPVIDLSLRLGFSREKPYTLDAPILLCSENGRKAGFIIDKIVGLADVSQESIQMSERFEDENSPFLASVTLNDEVTLLINSTRILEFDLTLKRPLEFPTAP